MLRTLYCVIACTAAVILSGCSSPTSSPEALVKSAFKAVKANDWQAYAPLIITTADFILKENKVSKFKQKLTYAGEILKPEEIALHKKQFGWAAAGGEGIVDFRQAKFEAATLIASGEQELLDGEVIPVSLYAVTLKGTAVPTALSPRFVVVSWGTTYRLLTLRFQKQDTEENQQ